MFGSDYLYVGLCEFRFDEWVLEVEVGVELVENMVAPNIDPLGILDLG